MELELVGVGHGLATQVTQEVAHLGVHQRMATQRLGVHEAHAALVTPVFDQRVCSCLSVVAETDSKTLTKGLLLMIKQWAF